MTKIKTAPNAYASHGPSCTPHVYDNGCGKCDTLAEIFAYLEGIEVYPSWIVDERGEFSCLLSSVRTLIEMSGEMRSYEYRHLTREEW